MPFDAERLIHENPPTTEQLHSLAAIGIRSAITRERFRPMKKTPGAHYFIDELDFLADASVEEDQPIQVRHRMAVRVGARPPQGRLDKVWSLKFTDTYFVPSREEAGEWVGERSTYRFEWTRSRVLMADHALRIIGLPLPDQDDLGVQLDTFRVRDDEAAILATSNDLRAVSADDCEEIMRDMKEYFSVLEGVSRR